MHLSQVRQSNRTSEEPIFFGGVAFSAAAVSAVGEHALGVDGAVSHARGGNPGREGVGRRRARIAALGQRRAACGGALFG